MAEYYIEIVMFEIERVYSLNILKMHVYFECDQGKYICYNCFYEFDILKQGDLKVYEEEIGLNNGTQVTASSISQH